MGQSGSAGWFFRSRWHQSGLQSMRVPLAEMPRMLTHKPGTSVGTMKRLGSAGTLTGVFSLTPQPQGLYPLMWTFHVAPSLCLCSRVAGLLTGGSRALRSTKTFSMLMPEMHQITSFHILLIKMGHRPAEIQCCKTRWAWLLGGLIHWGPSLDGN